MRQLLRLGLLTAAIGVSLLGASALRGTGHALAGGNGATTTSDVVSGGQFDDCTGQTITYTGTEHSEVHHRPDGSGEGNAVVHATGTDPTGTQYVLNVTAHVKADANGNASGTEHGVFVSKGSAPNELVDVTLTQNSFTMTSRCVG